jgi:hypothetical protein
VLRASHADRDRVVELLRVAAGDGRLTAEELDQRLEAALTARTLSELAVLTTDLPASADHPVEPAAPQPRDLVRIECGSGSARRDGSWVVPQRMEVSVTSGSVKLDFTRAVISAPLLTLRADVKSGNVTLITRPGIEVDTTDVGVKSGNVRVRTSSGPAVPTVLRIEVSGQVRSGNLKARPPRRTFWQWLLGRPATIPG